MKPRVKIPGTRGAFSLIEVTMALGLVSFSMLSILGLLPVGLKTFRDSKVETAMGGIQRQLRAEVLSEPFSSLETFAATTKLYFSDEGTLLASIAGAYYEATMGLTDTAAPGLTVTAPSSVRTLKVTLVSPCELPDAARKTNSFSILIANQKGELAN